ncbi:hypothetical protein [Vibrio crassostreae]|uniref:hypothetical protein n=1 Tax=Vibrio crassostreae TaxID=246167 RepID=UPI001B30CDBD|nr:hypothetical protein [Vibrio crassostreae]
MKALLKTIALTATLIASSQASAYTDLLADMAVYKTPEDVKAVKVDDLETDLEKFQYSYSKVRLSFDENGKNKLGEKLMPQTIIELKELHSNGFTPASLSLGLIEIGNIKRQCEKEEYQAKCLSVISPKVEGYLIPVANEDESGKAASLLSSYYLQTYTEKGREKNYEWSRIGKEKMTAYREEWRETGERPKPTFMLTDEEKKAKEEGKSFFSW